MFVLALGLGACAFDTGGLGADDDDDDGVDVDAAVDPPDAGPGDPDAAPGTPDASPGAPDAGPPDTDDDGIIDADDNCPTIGNTNQDNEDGDDHGDACDNCPHVANDDQADDREAQNGQDPDGVGDVCDPRPDRGGDAIIFFDGFHGNALSSDWQVGASTGSNEWQVDGDALVQGNGELRSNLLYWDGPSLDRVVVDARFEIDQITVPPTTPPEPPPPSRAVGVVAAFADTGEVGTGYGCMQYIDTREIDPDTWATVYQFNGDGVIAAGWSFIGSWDLGEGETYDYRMVFNAPADTPVTCAYFSGAIGPELTGFADKTYSEGRVGVRTFGVAATIPYIVVYELGPDGDGNSGGGGDPGDQP